LARRDRKGSFNNGQIQNPSKTLGIVPLSNFVRRSFGFVHHSIAILKYHEVPNPNLTIRNFFIAVERGAFWVQHLALMWRSADLLDGGIGRPAVSALLQAQVILPTLGVSVPSNAICTTLMSQPQRHRTVSDNTVM
jgi:hypothetical protein